MNNKDANKKMRSQRDAAIEQITILKNQIRLLGQALGNVLYKDGVTNTPGLTGPELLSMAENYSGIGYENENGCNRKSVEEKTEEECDEVKGRTQQQLYTP